MSKYEPLWKYVKEHNKDEYKLSFEEVKKIVGFEFDHAFLTFKKELSEYGYEFKKLSLKEKWVMIVKKNKQILKSVKYIVITVKLIEHKLQLYYTEDNRMIICQINDMKLLPEYIQHKSEKDAEHSANAALFK